MQSPITVTGTQAMDMVATVPGIVPSGTVTMDTEGIAGTGTVGMVVDTDMAAGTTTAAAVTSRRHVKPTQRRTWTNAPIKGWSR